MDPLFDRVVIVGAGLLGASLGLALRAAGATRHCIGVGRRQATLDTALALGAVDETALDLESAVAAADCIVLATPAATVVEALAVIQPHLRPGAVVVDVASTKGEICTRAAALWPENRPFVGCHPMAGSEKSGPEHATDSLYQNSVCFLEESPHIDPAASLKARALWEAVGARVVPVAPEAHDQILARTSHIPHILAALLALAAREAGARREFTGNGFRDMTRLAEGSPEMWRDITLTNRDAVLDGLESLRGVLNDFVTAVERRDGDGLMEFFARGQAARREVYGG